MACLVMTLEEMLKLALGTSSPDHINITILHSFLKIILQKLDIQTDFVECSGPEVCDLRQMLCAARNPTIEFCTSVEDGENCKCFMSEKVSKIENEINRLSGLVNKMESELQKHLDAIEACKKPPAASEMKIKRTSAEYATDEDSFSSECEDLCTPCDEKNLIACALLQNKTFLKKLMRRVTSPIIDRIFKFENMINLLNEKFQNFLNTAEDEFRKVPLIEECLFKLELVRKDVERQYIEFLNTMEEIQDILDTKLDKVHIPALKKYISDRLNEVEKQLKTVMYRETCPKAAGVIVENIRCICCKTKVCQNVGVYPVPMLASVPPSMSTGDNKGKKPHLCIPREQERACGGEHTIIRPGEKSLQKSNLIDDFGDLKHLRIGSENVEYFKGLDGGMYRLAPPEGIPCKQYT